MSDPSPTINFEALEALTETQNEVGSLLQQYRQVKGIHDSLDKVSVNVVSSEQRDPLYTSSIQGELNLLLKDWVRRKLAELSARASRLNDAAVPF